MKRYPLIYTLPALVVLLWATACTKQIEFTGEETDPQPVMVSYAEADSALRVRMTLSRFFLDDSPIQTVDNAVIGVELNGATPNVAFVAGRGGMFRSPLVLHEGDTLTLTATVPGYGSVKAGCRMPARPRISNFTVTENTLNADTLWMPDDQGNLTYETIYYYGNVGFKFTINDPPAEHNYYLVRAYMVKDSTGKRKSMNVTLDDDLIFENAMSEDILDFGVTVDYSHGTNVIFNDGNINGRSHTIEGWVESYDGYSDSNLRIWVEVCSVSRDTYLYMATLMAQNESGEEMGILSEPVQIHTNVAGGMGILGAITPVRIPITPNKASTHENTDNR